MSLSNQLLHLSGPATRRPNQSRPDPVQDFTQAAFPRIGSHQELTHEMRSKQDHVSSSTTESNSRFFALMFAVKLFETGGEGQGELKTELRVRILHLICN